MKRVGSQFKVRQDGLAEYREHHRRVCPEMLDALLVDANARPDETFVELEEYFHLD